jgi:ABC-type protease/lipase transport system fused ATPase/permease subunit
MKYTTLLLIICLLCSACTVRVKDTQTSATLRANVVAPVNRHEAQSICAMGFVKSYVKKTADTDLKVTCRFTKEIK